MVPTPQDGNGGAPSQSIPQGSVHPAAPSLHPELTPTYGPLVGKARWSRAGTSIGRVASSGGSRGLGRAAQRYVRALGGSHSASVGSPAGRQATARFAGFLSSVAKGGIASTFADLGLGSIVGRDLDSVIAAVADAICPSGAGREEVAAREATAEALEEVFVGIIIADAEATQLDVMTATDVGKAIEVMVSSYIYNRWLSDLGAKIEEKAISPREAVLVEQRMKVFIRDAVKLDLEQRDPLKVNWRGPEGRALIDQIYGDAFAIIGGER